MEMKYFTCMLFTPWHEITPEQYEARRAALYKQAKGCPCLSTEEQYQAYADKYSAALPADLTPAEIADRLRAKWSPIFGRPENAGKHPQYQQTPYLLV